MGQLCWLKAVLWSDPSPALGGWHSLPHHLGSVQFPSARGSVSLGIKGKGRCPWLLQRLQREFVGTHLTGTARLPEMSPGGAMGSLSLSSGRRKGRAGTEEHMTRARMSVWEKPKLDPSFIFSSWSSLLHHTGATWGSICPPGDAIILGNVPFSSLAQGFPRSALMFCIIGQILFLLWTELIITKMGPWPGEERHLPFEGFLRHSLKEEVTGRKQYLEPSGPDTCCDLLMHAFVQQTLTKRLLVPQEGTENKMQVSLYKTNYNFKLRAFSPLPYASYAEVTS